MDKPLYIPAHKRRQNLELEKTAAATSPGQSKSIHAEASVISSVATTTVLECFDFPSTFKDADLIRLIGTQEFTIKWVDDTSCLLVFRDAETGIEA